MTTRTARKPAGRIAFIGAGPGDPELLTRRAYAALTDADPAVRRLAALALFGLSGAATNLGVWLIRRPTVPRRARFPRHQGSTASTTAPAG